MFSVIDNEIKGDKRYEINLKQDLESLFGHGSGEVSITAYGETEDEVKENFGIEISNAIAYLETLKTQL